MSRIPEPLMRSSSAAFTIGELVHRHGRTEETRAHYKDDTCEWVLGKRIPPFQRPAVWTREQQTKFIISAWAGFHLGIYVVNRCDEWQGEFIHHTDGWLIDGQQRLRALQAYIEDEFSVYSLRYSELTAPERRRFEAIGFACSIIHEKDEVHLMTLYNLLNYGGTPHAEAQRAKLPKGFGPRRDQTP